MISRAALFVNASPTAVEAGGAVPLTDKTNLSTISYQETGKILLKAPGNYKIDAAFVVSSDSATTATIAIPSQSGAASSATLGEGDTAALSISTLVNVKSQYCSNTYATVTFEVANAIVVDSASVTVERLCG